MNPSVGTSKDDNNVEPASDGGQCSNGSTRHSPFILPSTLQPPVTTTEAASQNMQNRPQVHDSIAGSNTLNGQEQQQEQQLPLFTNLFQPTGSALPTDVQSNKATIPIIAQQQQIEQSHLAMDVDAPQQDTLPTETDQKRLRSATIRTSRPETSAEARSDDDLESFAVVDLPPECKPGDTIQISVPSNNGEPRILGMVVPPIILKTRGHHYILVNTSVHKRPRLTMESFARLPSSSSLCSPRKSPQVVARRKPLHRAASAADEWKKERSKYPQKSSSIGKRYQVSFIPDREENYSASDSLYDLVYDPKYPPLVLPPILQKSSPETCLVDWTESQRKRFHVMMVRTMKNVSSVSKLLGNIGIGNVLDYYYGSYKGTPNYALLKETCPKHFEEDVLCGMCKKPGAIIACDNCTDAFHLECLTPPLKEIPTTDHFECNICIQEKDNIDKSTGTKNATHHKTTQQLKKDILSTATSSKTKNLLNRAVTSLFGGTPSSTTQPDEKEYSSLGKDDASENNYGSEFSSSMNNSSSSCSMFDPLPSEEASFRRSGRARRQSLKVSESQMTPSKIVETRRHSDKFSGSHRTPLSKTPSETSLGSRKAHYSQSSELTTSTQNDTPVQRAERKSKRKERASERSSSNAHISAQLENSKKSKTRHSLSNQESPRSSKGEQSTRMNSSSGVSSSPDRPKKNNTFHRHSKKEEQSTRTTTSSGISSSPDRPKKNNDSHHHSNREHASPAQLRNQIKMAKLGVPFFVSAKTSCVYYESLQLFYPITARETVVPWNVSVGDIVAVKIDQTGEEEDHTSPFGTPWGAAQIIAMWREVSKDESSEFRRIISSKSPTKHPEKGRAGDYSETFEREKISVEIRWFYRQSEVPDRDKLVLGDNVTLTPPPATAQNSASAGLVEVFETDHIDTCELSCLVGSVQLQSSRPLSTARLSKRSDGFPTAKLLCRYFYFVVRKKLTTFPSYLGETQCDRALAFSRVMKLCPSLRPLSLEWLAKRPKKEACSGEKQQNKAKQSGH